MLILGNTTVRELLDGQETDVLEAVRDAYVRHARGETVVPHSLFLRFPGNPRDRGIALPAHLGGTEPVTGLKWITSFPGNVAAGLERASAVVILNDPATGQPVCMLEGSTISARRTAASAALAAVTLPGATPTTGVSLIGCGVINAEVLRFLAATHPSLREVMVFDLDHRRASDFAARCAADHGLSARVARHPDEALAAHRLVSLATTASTPHLGLGACQPGTLVLHVSLRDVDVRSVLNAINIVDDADHVCRAATSVHLAEQQVGHREFIQAELGELLRAAPAPRDPEAVTLFSPFGLGALDLAVADLVQRRARDKGLGIDLPDFLPTSRAVPVS